MHQKLWGRQNGGESDVALVIVSLGAVREESISLTHSLLFFHSSVGRTSAIHQLVLVHAPRKISPHNWLQGNFC